VSPLEAGAPEPDAAPALEATLRAGRRDGRKLLIPYLMAGMTEDWEEALQAVAASGADAVEVGIPFSDPMMDGPVIQEAAVRALDRGTTPARVIDGVARAQLGVPVAVMTYYNIVFRAGHRRMARSLRDAGIGGAIVPDLPLEELAPWAEEADAADVATVLLVAPSTPGDRVAAICARSRGFVYAVARMGVTGERESLGAETATVVGRIRRATDAPVCVGVGISTPQHARAATETADGVVVGSALVRRLLEGGGPDAAAEFVGRLRSALDEG
jgi:tryptophan synthase alpha chain